VSELALLGRATKALLLAVALVVPVYFFVAARAPKAPARQPPTVLPAPRPLAPRLHGAFRPQAWVDEGKHRLPTADFPLGALNLQAPARHWRAAYYLPTQTVRWRNYRVHILISRLGRPGSGANATLILGTGPRLAVTLSASRITINRLVHKRRLLLLSRRLVPASAHSITTTLAGVWLRVRVDDALLVERRIGRIGGGIGLGVWRAQVISPQPLFSKLSLRVG